MHIDVVTTGPQALSAAFILITTCAFYTPAQNILLQAWFRGYHSSAKVIQILNEPQIP